ncbi:MAG TPA: c-type cytochrome [Methylococcaceae bacterium]|jgi:cytochrome c5|nr:c-type cytochrome [Methylococcaceae bacterium]
MNHMLRLVTITAIVLLFGQSWAEAENRPDPASDLKLDVGEGKRVYQSSCSGCHDTGKNRAPKLADKDAWAKRSFEWFSVMNNHATKGFLNMPPKGQHYELTDQDMANAVFYMLDQIREKP